MLEYKMSTICDALAISKVGLVFAIAITEFAEVFFIYAARLV